MTWNDAEQLKKRFHFLCDVDWEEMTPTERAGVRNCARCDKAVFAVETEAGFNHHARLGHCVIAATAGGTALLARPDAPDGAPPPSEDAAHQPSRVVSSPPPPLAGAPISPPLKGKPALNTDAMDEARPPATRSPMLRYRVPLLIVLLLGGAGAAMVLAVLLSTLL